MKRALFLSLLLTAILALFCLTASAEAYSGYCGGEGDGTNLTWELDTNSGILVIKGSGTMKDYNGGDSPWYNKRSAINKIVVGSDVTRIGVSAFNYCRSLTSVEIGDSVITIGGWAFYNCDILSSVVFGDSVTTVESTAFASCYDLSDVYYYGTVEQWNGISIRAYNSYLTEATRHYMASNYTTNSDETHAMQDTCTDCGATLGEAVTENCIDENTDGLCDLCGGAVGIFASGYCGGEGDGTNLTWKLSEDGTLTISGVGEMQKNGSEWSAYKSLIKQAVIEDGVTSISTSPFYDCEAMTSMIIGAGVKNIEFNIWGSWSQIVEIIVSEDNTTYMSKDGVLYSKDMSELVFFPGGKNETHWRIPDNVTTIGHGAFIGCLTLESVAIPDSVTKVGNLAFAWYPNHPKDIYYFGSKERWALATYTEPGTVPWESQWDLYTEIHYVDETYTANDNGTHTVFEFVCSECGGVFGETAVEECIDNVIDGICDICGGVTCYHDNALVEYVFNNDGATHSVVISCFDCMSVISEVAKEACTFVDGVCEQCGGEEIKKFSIAAANMTLGNDLRMNFAIKTADLKEDYVVKVKQAGKEAVLKPEYHSAVYSKVVYPVSAKEMTDIISIEIYDANGNLVSKPFSRTVKQYATTLLTASTSSDSLKSVVVDMLNYGTEAQKYFHYHEDAYANAQITAEQQAQYATADVEVADHRVKGTNYYASKLTLGDSIPLTMAFKRYEEGMYATVSYTDFRGREQSFEDVPVTKSGSYAAVTVNQIVLGDAKCDVTVTVYKADGTLHGTATDSVASYVARTGDSALNKAIMKLATSAAIHLG